MKTGPRKPQAIPLDEITAKVAKTMNLTRQEVRSKSRTEKLFYSRVLIAYYAQKQGHAVKCISYEINRSTALVSRYKTVYARLSYKNHLFIAWRNLVTVALYS